MPVKRRFCSSARRAGRRRLRPQKVGFVSLGCPKNLVDSEVMMGLLSQGGAQITSRAEDADIIVVNTCSFIDTAKQESVDTILEMAQHKTAGRAKKLIVAGCLVERYRNEIQKEHPGSGRRGRHRRVATNSRRRRNPATAQNDAGPFVILNSRSEGDARESAGRFSKDGWDGAIADLPNYLYDENTPRLLATPKYTAYIKIAEGCDHPCSFCIIPQLRGKFRSRRFESVIAEAEQLAKQGVREITLIGQDTTCYGEDLGLKDGLALLLERLAQIEELRWVRFLYAYPNKITGKLLDTIAANEKICSYIDVPLQHASPAVLKNMKRGAGADIFLKSIAKMRREISDLTLRTSFIVGFPGETAEDFEILCDFVREAQFDWLGVFGYSDEEGATAFDLGRKGSPTRDRAPPQEADVDSKADQPQEEARADRPQFDLLLEGPSEETDLLWQGRTAMHAPEIDGTVYVNDIGDREDVREGEFYRCEITEAHEYDLVARIL